MESSRIFGLDFLRFLAITFVVIGHGLVLLPEFPYLYNFFNVFGFIGVEFFFVLSGFLIGRIFIKSINFNSSFDDLIVFWKRRWWRTLPNYYLFIIINLIGFSILKDNFVFDWRYLIFLQNITHANEGFFSVSWSLTIEEWFYLTIPIFYFFGVKILRSKDFSIALTVTLVMFLSLSLRHYYIENSNVTWNDDIRRVAILRMDSLIFGVLAAWLWTKNKNFLVDYKNKIAAVGVIFLSLGVAMRNHPNINNEYWILLLLFPTVSFGISCFIPKLNTWTHDTNKDNWLVSWITRVSLWSYSLYLIHVPALEGFRIFLIPKLVNNPTGQIMLFFLWVSLSIFLSWLLYKYFERPMTSFRDK